MAYTYQQGLFRPRNPQKYQGDPTKIIYRSSWELKVMSWLDRTPEILEWASEEMLIPYISPLDNKVHRYFPDFKIKIKTYRGFEIHIVEVKPETQIQPPVKKKKVTKAYIHAISTYEVNQAKWKSARQYCEKQGYKFTLLNEYDIGIAKRPS